MSIGNLIILFIASRIRLRVSRQIVSQSDKTALIRTSLGAIIAVLVLSAIHRSQSQGRIQSPYTQISILGTIFIISIIALQIKRFQAWVSQSLIRRGLSFLPSLRGQYSFVARSEESLKRQHLQKQSVGPRGTIILLSMMSGLVFGRTENIIYAIAALSQDHNALQIISQRSLIPIVLHTGTVTATCLIAARIQTHIGSWRGRFFGLGTGVLLHLLFNINQAWGNSIVSAIILIICLGCISYGLMRSDALYVSSSTSDPKIPNNSNS